MWLLGRVIIPAPQKWKRQSFERISKKATLLLLAVRLLTGTSRARQF